MNIKEYKKILELLPLGFAFYDGNGDLIYSNKNASRISPDIFPKKFKDLIISPKNIRKLNTGKTTFIDDYLYYNLNIKPLNKMEQGCIILARDTSDKSGYAYRATHDSMTGLYNRGFLETEFERFKNGRDSPVSVIFLDIDKLKTINDTHGHVAGDKVIKNTGEIIKKSIRKSDVAARMGGDEFVILIPKADNKIALRIMDTINNKVLRQNKKSKIPLSVSMGYTTANDKNGMRFMLSTADRNMYKNKNNNRQTY
ncbi:MAG: GGDEF domain-containing protein [Patescibacteria group bacterium]|nr:GGDEF domain-containing protein [Patescibacteria group bacterium]MBU1952882.1 GGDEF domain-containing protein [Patescibacteria group bacterium]